MRPILLSLLGLAGLLSGDLARAEGPAVTIVTAADAPALERLAATELRGLLEVLFDAEVKISAGVVPENPRHLILLGPSQARSALPDDLGEQGHVVQSTLSGLVIAGGSPAATLWAVYEYGYANGMRYLVGGDFPPVERPAFTTEGFDLVCRPRRELRAWRVATNGPASQASWTGEEFARLCRQLAKMRFNAVLLPAPGEAAGFDPIPVTGDIAGRSVFGGAREFSGFDSAETWLAGIRESAKSVGMTSELDATSVTLLSLGQAKGGLLPWSGPIGLPKGDFAVGASLVGDINPELHYLSRSAWDDAVTPEGALRDLATPICGEGVAESLALGFAAIADVSALIDKEATDFAVPDPELFMEHYVSADPAPEWWAEGKELYGKAVGEMYRANTRARDGARPWILHHAKRYTFALHYLTAVESVRNAAIAREAKDHAAWGENLELSIEALHNALGIYAEVAGDSSDRGAIALINELAYRPLLKELDQVPLE